MKNSFGGTAEGLVSGRPLGQQALAARVEQAQRGGVADFSEEVEVELEEEEPIRDRPPLQGRKKPGRPAKKVPMAKRPAAAPVRTRRVVAEDPEEEEDYQLTARKATRRASLRKQENAATRYRACVLENLRSGQLMVFIRKFSPDSHECGGHYAGQLPTYDRLLQFVQDNFWRGDKCQFAWTLQLEEQILEQGEIDLAQDRLRQKQIEDYLGPQAPQVEEMPPLPQALVPWQSPNGQPIPQAPPVMRPGQGGQYAVFPQQPGFPSQTVYPQHQQHGYPQQPQQPVFQASPYQQPYQAPPVVTPHQSAPYGLPPAFRPAAPQPAGGFAVPAEEDEEADPMADVIERMEQRISDLQDQLNGGTPPGMPMQGVVGYPGHGGHPAYPGHPGHPGMPGYTGFQQPPTMQDEMQRSMQKLVEFKRLSQEMGIAPSDDVTNRIRELERQMLSEKEAHKEQIVKMQMDGLKEELAALKKARAGEAITAASAASDTEQTPQFEDFEGIKVPKDPETGELDFSMGKLLALNGAKVLETVSVLATMYMDAKKTQTEAQAAAIAAMQRQAAGLPPDQGQPVQPEPQATAEPPPRPQPSPVVLQEEPEQPSGDDVCAVP